MSPVDPTPPNRWVAILCSSCPADAEPLGTAQWHTSAPSETFDIEMGDGLVVEHIGTAERSYMVKCERESCPERWNGTTMTKTQWLAMCTSAPVSIP